MKKIFLPLIAIAMTLSCSTDDDASAPENTIPDVDTTTEEPDGDAGNGLLRITEVDAQNDVITISNWGNADLEIGDYFLCLGPGSYATIGSLSDDDTSLEPNESLEISYDVNQTAGGLGVFATNAFSTTDANILLDYVQWGAANQARVDQAVTAGRWDNASNVAPGVNVFTFTGAISDVGSTFWEGDTATESVLRILNVNPEDDTITLTAIGDTTLDVGNYWLCLGPGTYARVGAIASGDTELSDDETLTLSYDVNPTAGGLSIFSTNTFSSSDPDVLVDFVQWGAGSQPRASQAVTAGRWDATDSFVPQATSYTYVGNASDVGADFWE